MIKMKISTIKGPKFPYVTDEELARAIREAYPDKADGILNTIERDLIGNSRLEQGIYPWDLAAIMLHHNLPHQFTADGKVTEFNAGHSGIYW